MNFYVTQIGYDTYSVQIAPKKGPKSKLKKTCEALYWSASIGAVVYLIAEHGSKKSAKKK